MNLTFLVGEYDSLVHLTSDSLSIPYIITRTHGHYDWRDAGGKQTCAVPLTTNPTILHQAVYDLAMRYHWKTIGVIYDSTEGDMRSTETPHKDHFTHNQHYDLTIL